MAAPVTERASTTATRLRGDRVGRIALHRLAAVAPPMADSAAVMAAAGEAVSASAPRHGGDAVRALLLDLDAARIVERVEDGDAGPHVAGRLEGLLEVLGAMLVGVATDFSLGQPTDECIAEINAGEYLVWCEVGIGADIKFSHSGMPFQDRLHFLLAGALELSSGEVARSRRHEASFELRQEQLVVLYDGVLQVDGGARGDVHGGHGCRALHAGLDLAPGPGMVPVVDFHAYDETIFPSEPIRRRGRGQRLDLPARATGGQDVRELLGVHGGVVFFWYRRLKFPVFLLVSRRGVDGERVYGGWLIVVVLIVVVSPFWVVVFPVGRPVQVDGS